MMNEEDEMHSDPNNWRLGIFYFNPKDKRLVVFKRIPSMGITVNFANPFSGIILLGLILAIWIASHG